jgi:hypothetical protein
MPELTAADRTALEVSRATIPLTMYLKTTGGGGEYNTTGSATVSLWFYTAALGWVVSLVSYTAFGSNVDTLNGITSVTFTSETSPTLATATPASQTCIATVTPANGT